MNMPHAKTTTAARASAHPTWVSVVLSIFLWTACSHDDDKALRTYDAALEPARRLMAEVVRAQPRLGERRSVERLRVEVETRFLPQVKAVLDELAGVTPAHPTLATLHTELVAIWREYYDVFRELPEDLSQTNLDEKRAHVAAELRALGTRWHVWNSAAEALHESITGWHG